MNPVPGGPARAATLVPVIAVSALAWSRSDLSCDRQKAETAIKGTGVEARRWQIRIPERA